MSDKKRESPIRNLKGLIGKLKQINEDVDKIRADNRRVQLELTQAHVKVLKKPSEFAGMFDGLVIIDPDLIIYTEDKDFGKVAKVVSEINQKLRGMDLSTPAKIMASADSIRTALIIGLDQADIEYIFV